MVLQSSDVVDTERAVQFEGTMTLPQWASVDGVYALSFIMVGNVWGDERFYDTSQLPVWTRLQVEVRGAKTDSIAPELLLLALPDVVPGPFAKGVE